MNSEEFMLLDYLSRYQDGISRADYVFNQWVHTGDSMCAVEKKI